MKSGALSHEYKAMAEGCGISGMRFYNLRLTHASLLLTSNIPIQVVQARIGNESIQTTVGTYGHVLAGSDVEGEKGRAMESRLAAPFAKCLQNRASDPKGRSIRSYAEVAKW